jgi:hypothetical protein
MAHSRESESLPSNKLKLHSSQNSIRKTVSSEITNFESKFEDKIMSSHTHHAPPISQEHQHTLRTNFHNLAEKLSSRSAKFHLSETAGRYNE